MIIVNISRSAYCNIALCYLMSENVIDVGYMPNWIENIGILYIKADINKMAVIYVFYQTEDKKIYRLSCSDFELAVHILFNACSSYTHTSHLD